METYSACALVLCLPWCRIVASRNGLCRTDNYHCKYKRALNKTLKCRSYSWTHLQRVWSSLRREQCLGLQQQALHDRHDTLYVSSDVRFCGSLCISLLQGAIEKGKSWLEPNWGTHHVDPHMRWSSADVQSGT